MRILLSYSRLHFDPDKDPKEHKYWGSSASIIARTVYKTLLKYGDVTYIDASEYRQIKNENYDLFFGVKQNFSEIIKNNKIGKSIYLAGNMFPVERNKILLKFIKDEKIPFSAVYGNDFVSEKDEGIFRANYILGLFGNVHLLNSYLKNGVQIQKMKLLHFGSIDRKINKKLFTFSSEKRFIYVVSEIGLRKGFDIVCSIFSDRKLYNRKFILTILGLPTNNFYDSKLNSLKKLLGSKLIYYGWIDSSSEYYQEILMKNDFLIFPTLEEGQGGTLVDALSCGVIPLISNNVGVTYAPFGRLELKVQSFRNLDIIEKVFQLMPSELLHYKKKTLDYYLIAHKNYKFKFEEAIQRIINGRIYPTINLKSDKKIEARKLEYPTMEIISSVKKQFSKKLYDRKYIIFFNNLINIYKYLIYEIVNLIDNFDTEDTILNLSLSDHQIVVNTIKNNKLNGNKIVYVKNFNEKDVTSKSIILLRNRVNFVNASHQRISDHLYIILIKLHVIMRRWLFRLFQLFSKDKKKIYYENITQL